jgi:HK97 gp10 family phage protein
MIVWKGTDELQQALKEAGRDADRLGAAALNVEAEKIMTESKRITPVDTGRLRSSGHVKSPTRSGSMITVVMAFATDYALFVHEGTRRMAGRKYLEGPVRAAASGLEKRLADRIRGVF